MHARTLVFALSFLLAASAAAGPVVASVNVAISVVDEKGKPLRDALILITSADDPGQTITIGENDAGAYAETISVPAPESTWRITRVVAAGYLPTRIHVVARSAEGAVEETPATELDPATPMPEFKLLDGGSAKIELNLGPRAEVLARFAETREKPQAPASAAPAGDTAYARALRLYGEGKIDESLGEFERAVAEQPGDGPLRVTYAKVLYRAKRTEQFEKTAREALALVPDDADLPMMLYTSARDRGDMKAALDALMIMKRSDRPRDDLLKHFEYLAQKLGRTPDAIAAYEAIVELDGRNVQANVELALLHTERGDVAAADRYLGKAVELAPARAPTIYLEIASKLVGAKEVKPADLERAVRMLRKSIELDPALAPAYRRLGQALWMQEDWSGAHRAYAKYLELSPNAPDRADVERYLSRLPE